MSREQRRGAIVVAAMLLLIFVAFSGQVPLFGGESGTTITARFAQANQLDDTTPVRLGGVDVGHVSSMRAAPGNTTDVAMLITSAGVHLHSDAGAEIRWRTLLGGSMYIDLTAGSPSGPRLSGTIPVANTGTQVDWDQLNGQLNAATRPQFERMLKGLSSALTDPVGEGATLHVLGPDSSVIGQGSDALRGSQTGDLQRLVSSSATVVKALGSNTTDLQRLVDGAQQTLSVTASHNQALARALQLTPPALDSTLATNHKLDTTLSALDPLVSRLRPGARLLAPTTTVLAPMLVSLRKVLDDARPLLHVAPSALGRLASMSRQGVPLIAGLNPVISRLNGKLIPFLGTVDPDTRLRLYETIGPLASALSSSASLFDANGYTYNFDVQGSSGSVLLPCATGPAGTQVQQCLLVQHAIRDLLGGKR